MHSKKIFFITITLLIFFSNGVSFAQIKSEKKSKEEDRKTTEKIVHVTEKPYSDSEIVMDDAVPKVSMDDNDPNKIHAMPEIKAEYKNGSKAFLKYIFDRYKSPTEEEINSKVYISFVVEKDGTLSDIKLIRDPGYGIGKEILKIIKTSPKWNPAIQNGRTVRSSYLLPISVNPK